LKRLQNEGAKVLANQWGHDFSSEIQDLELLFSEVKSHIQLKQHFTSLQ
jgi:hypothetical protein